MWTDLLDCKCLDMEQKGGGCIDRVTSLQKNHSLALLEKCVQRITTLVLTNSYSLQNLHRFLGSYSAEQAMSSNVIIKFLNSTHDLILKHGKFEIE